MDSLQIIPTERKVCESQKKSLIFGIIQPLAEKQGIIIYKWLSLTTYLVFF
jgi:hypothetical protein